MDDLPTIPRLAVATTICYGFVLLLFVTFILWISMTTGEPLLLNPHAYGEAETEAVMLAVITGIACYGMAVFDWLLRG